MSLVKQQPLAPPLRRIWGCGSCVADLLIRVSSCRPDGGKVLALDSPSLGKVTPGGVALNQMCWAAALGAPAGVMGLVGKDAAGKLLRRELKVRGVDYSMLVAGDVPTAESIVMSEPASADRSIVMYRGATATIGKAEVKLWSKQIREGDIFVTEVSQVALEHVAQLLAVAQSKGALTALDVDVPPSVACHGTPQLGSEEELWGCLRRASVIKITNEGARELVGGDGSPGDVLSATAGQMAIVTDGDKGSRWSTPAVPNEADRKPWPLKNKFKYSLGAGDAFFGGVMAGLYAENNRIPSTLSEIEELAAHAKGCAALCGLLEGALPPLGMDLSEFSDQEIHPEASHNNIKLLVGKLERLVASHSQRDATSRGKELLMGVAGEGAARAWEKI